MTPQFFEAARHAAALVLVHFAWQGCALWIIGLCVLHAARGATPQARYALCCGLLAALAACPAVTCWIVFERPESPGAGAVSTAHVSDVPAAALPGLATSLHHAASPMVSLERCEPWLVTAWLAGAVVFAARLVVGMICVARIKGHKEPLPPHLAPLVERMIARLAFRTRPDIYVVNQLSQAMAVGIFKPLVLLPAGWLIELPPSVLETVIAHELTHLRRWDLTVNLLQRVLECALFFHPVVWWCSRRLRIEREICCDALALAAVGSRTSYAKALTFLAHRRLAASEPLVAAGIGGPQMVLLERIRQVLDPTACKQSRFYGATCAAAGAVAASVAWLAGVALFLTPAKAVAPRNADPPDIVQRTELAVNSNAGVTGKIVSVPTEHKKVTLPAYTIEPPDILFIEVPRVVAVDHDRIQPGHVLKVRVGDGGMSATVTCRVDADGAIEPIPGSGKIVDVAGVTPAEAAEKIRARGIFVDPDRLIPTLPGQVESFKGAKVTVTISRPPAQPITGEHLVAPDGTVNLGTYGQVFVSGMTVQEVKAAIDKHLAAFLDKPDATVQVFAYNSKVYFVFIEGGDDVLHRFPITGNETVLDALAQVNGFDATSKKRIFIARPRPGGGAPDAILPVDWEKITRGADAASNYQLLPGDRIFVTDEAASEAAGAEKGVPVPGKDRVFTQAPASPEPSSSAPPKRKDSTPMRRKR